MMTQASKEIRRTLAGKKEGVLTATRLAIVFDFPNPIAQEFHSSMLSRTSVALAGMSRCEDRALGQLSWLVTGRSALLRRRLRSDRESPFSRDRAQRVPSPQHQRERVVLSRTVIAMPAGLLVRPSPMVHGHSGARVTARHGRIEMRVI
jgi:hypothetical protein